MSAFAIRGKFFNYIRDVSISGNVSAALPVVVDVFDVDDARTAALRFGDFFDSSWKNASKYFLARKNMSTLKLTEYLTQFFKILL